MSPQLTASEVPAAGECQGLWFLDLSILMRLPNMITKEKARPMLLRPARLTASRGANSSLNFSLHVIVSESTVWMHSNSRSIAKNPYIHWMERLLLFP